jgi:hypothetical protein
MKASFIHGTTLGFADPTLWCERVSDSGHIKYDADKRYVEIPNKILLIILCTDRRYLVRNAVRVEIACRRIQDFRLTGNM